MSEHLHFYSAPHLSGAEMLAGFQGWPDGGKVSSLTLTYLTKKMECNLFAEISPEGFYDFSEKRPLVSYRGGVLESYALPKNEFYYSITKDGKRSFILLLGEEPNLNWVTYVDTILEVARMYGVRRVVTVGGLLDRIPHTVEPVISFSTNMAERVERGRMLDAEPTNYVGPSSVHSLILHRCRETGIEAISLWGHSPFYLTGPDLQTTYHVTKKLVGLMALSTDVEDLEQESREYRSRIDLELERQPELKKLVSELEEEYQVSKRRPSYVS